MEKWIVLGANGQLGTEWKQQMAKRKRSVQLIGYNSSQLDITDANNTQKVLISEDPDVIINCAAYTGVDQAEKERKKAERINSLAVRNLASISNEIGCLLIHYSTDYVFSGAKADQQKHPTGYTEDLATDPVNWYGMTKWKGEQAIKKSGCRYLILRLSWLCGAYGQNFITSMLRLAQTKYKLNVVDNQLGSPTFTRNTVLNTLNLIEQEQQGTFHLTSQGLISWAAFAQSIFELSNLSVEVNPIPSSQYPTDAKRPYFSKLNTAKVEKVPGTKIVDWKQGLKRLLYDIN